MDHEGLGTNTQSFTQLTALQDDGQRSGAHEQRDAPVENYDRQVAFGEACFSLVQDYRGGRRTKADTVQRLVHIVSDEQARVGPDTAERVSNAFPAFFEMLEDFDRERTAAVQEGASVDEDQRGTQEVRQESNPPVPVSKRTHLEDDDGSHPAKRPLDRDLLPFVSSDVTNLAPDLARTWELQENYARDPALAKSLLLRNPQRPDFPTSVWGDVLSNAYVDLNRIFDAHYATNGEGQKAVHRLGDFQLVSDSPKIKRQIRTHGNWFTA